MQTQFMDIKWKYARLGVYVHLIYPLLEPLLSAVQVKWKIDRLKAGENRSRLMHYAR